MVTFGLDLRIGHSLGGKGMLNRGVFIHTRPIHDPFNAVTAKPANNLIFHRRIETRAAGVSLPTRPSPKLIVNSPGFVVLGAYNVKPTQFNDPVMLFLPFCLLTPLGIATKYNIHTAAGHVRGHGHRSDTPGLSDYPCLFLMILGIQYLMGNAVSLQEIR
jgi:hypothetical protein